jgi:predicted transcriptional regulator
VESAKQEVQKILDELPDGASLEEIQYRIYVRQKIRQGLEDIEAGRVLTQDEVEKRMSRWIAVARVA